MGEVKRQKSVEEFLEVNPCPFCRGGVITSDCGYAAFNMGSARCTKCLRTWHLGLVDDSWDAAVRWNRYQPFAVEIEKLELKLKEMKEKAGLRGELRLLCEMRDE